MKQSLINHPEVNMPKSKYTRDPSIIYFGGRKGDTRRLSNMVKCKIYYSGQSFASAEHLYRFLKICLAASYTDDPSSQELLMNDAEVVRKTAGSLKAHFAAKALEHKLPAMFWVHWRSHAKMETMQTALQAKFTGAWVACSNARKTLLETGDAPLALVANHNSFWGLGADGKGANMLGFLLVQLRATLAGNDEWNGFSLHVERQGGSSA